MSKFAAVIVFALSVFLCDVVRADRPATVLLITSADLAGAWQPFADWKTRLGKATTILTVDAIKKKYEGDDVQAKIRAAVLDHIDNRGTRWVILGGDSEPDGGGIVPHRVSPHRATLGRGAPAFRGPNQMEMGGSNIPTDLYYLSPGDHDWDANDDGVYGDWRNDKDAIAYTHPTGASIARIPLRSAVDVAAYTEKIIGYESRYPTDKFAQRFMYTNTVNGSEPKVRRSWDDYVSKAWPDGSVSRYFHTSTPWDEKKSADYPLNATNWTKRINDRTASKMHMHGHGMPQFWVLEHSTGNTPVHPGVVNQLQNTDAYLVMTTVSCFTGQFDTKGDPCIAETMLRAPKRGAVIVVAPSRPGMPVFHNPRRDFPLMVREGKLDGTTETMTRFWTNGLKPRADGSYRTAGEAMAETKKQMAPHAAKTEAYHMIQCELNLLGDPTLDLRAKDPFNATLEAPKSIKTGEQELTVKTQPGLTVCATMGDAVYVTAVANDKGVAKLKITPKSAGKLHITASGANANVATQTITVK